MPSRIEVLERKSREAAAALELHRRQRLVRAHCDAAKTAIVKHPADAVMALEAALRLAQELVRESDAKAESAGSRQLWWEPADGK